MVKLYWLLWQTSLTSTPIPRIFVNEKNSLGLAPSTHTHMCVCLWSLKDFAVLLTVILSLKFHATQIGSLNLL